jgi:hypothetical protein
VAEDPGWVPAVGNFWRVLLFPTIAMRGRSMQRTPVLISLRMMTVAAPVSWLLIYSVLTLLHRQSRPEGVTLMVIVIVLDGVLSLVIFQRLHERALSTVDDATLASEYRAVYLLGWALTGSVVLVGFVGVFITGRLWLYALALPFGIAGIWLLAPSRGRIARDQISLRAARWKLVLLEALMLPNGAVPQRPNRPKKR